VAPRTPKPVLLYCGRRSASDADVRRLLSLVICLADHFRVALMIPSRFRSQFPLLDGVEFLDAPDVSMRSDGRPSAEAPSLRPEEAISRFVELAPSVVVIEGYPFERPANTSVDTILACSAAAPRSPLMICSLLDPMYPLATSQADQERMARVLNSRFHAVLVHSDPSFSRLEEHFRTPSPLTIPVHHPGFIPLDARETPIEREPRVLVHLSGNVNEQVLHAAVEAHRLLGSSDGTHMTIAAQATDEAAWRWLSTYAADVPRLTLRHVAGDEVGLEMTRIASVVCLCSYHNMCDVLSSRTPARFIHDPHLANSADRERAHRLGRFSPTAVVDARYLNGPTLASNLRRLNRLRPPGPTLDFNGAETAAGLVRELAYRCASGTELAHGGP